MLVVASMTSFAFEYLIKGKKMNIWIGSGNLGQDPKVRTTESGKTVVNMDLACERSFIATGTDGSRQVVKTVDWIPVVAWDGLANSAKSLRKGSKILLTGELRRREYFVDKDGTREKRIVYEVVASKIEFLPKSSPTEQTTETPEG
jgi:single stranded DNA-binding protein